MNNIDFWLGLGAGIFGTLAVVQILHEQHEAKVKKLATLYAKHMRSGQ